MFYLNFLCKKSESEIIINKRYVIKLLNKFSFSSKEKKKNFLRVRNWLIINNSKRALINGIIIIYISCKEEKKKNY